jgi:UrcA family protein
LAEAQKCGGHDKQRMFEMATPKLISLSVLAASALAISAPAMANQKTTLVTYQDLDLSTATGQQRLNTRIKQAVKQVCATPQPITLKERMDQNVCKKNALADATPKAEQAIAAYVESRRFASREEMAIVGN